MIGTNLLPPFIHRLRNTTLFAIVSCLVLPPNAALAESTYSGWIQASGAVQIQYRWKHEKAGYYDGCYLEYRNMDNSDTPKYFAKVYYVSDVNGRESDSENPEHLLYFTIAGEAVSDSIGGACVRVTDVRLRRY